MLKQRINLGQSTDSTSRVEILPFEKCLMIQKYFLILMLLSYVVTLYNVIELYFKVHFAPENTQVLIQKYEKMKMMFPDLSQSGNIEESIALMQKEIDDKKKKLSSVLSPYHWVFSEGLGFISKSSNQGMWVNEFSFDFEKNNSVINGYAFSLGSVNDFSKLLNNNPWNKKNRVNVSNIDQSNTEDGRVLYQFAIQLVGNA